jgi:thiosulfate/3-mercaptopyruvate sulfurtransferase
MKKASLVVCLIITLFLVPVTLFARDISPIVSTDWLEQNLSNPKLKIVDIRKLEEYKDGHIPGAVSAFYGIWAVKKNDLLNELPLNDELADLVSSLGINNDSLVVVAGKADNTGELVNITRVAWTLKYEGIENVAILDGAYNKWLNDKKAMSKDVVRPAASNYKAKWNNKILTTRDYLMKIPKQSVIIIDVRMPEFFFGVAKLDFVKKVGHIKGAKNLPAAWIYTKDGTFKNKEDLGEMASGVVGKNMSKEVIVYCDTGKFSTAWWYILSEVLGYKNVKSYDGSTEEWTRDPKAPFVKYSW